MTNPAIDIKASRNQQHQAECYAALDDCLRAYESLPAEVKIVVLLRLAVSIANDNAVNGKHLPIESVIVGADTHTRIITACFTDKDDDDE